MADPSHVLGVSSTATARELRAAFRRLALRYHPDHNPGDPLAGDRFKELLRAYRVALARAAQGPGVATPAEPCAGPRPDRYECGTCGDCFPFAEACSRCGRALWDRSAGPAPREESAAVRTLIAELEARPEPTGPTWEERLPVPGLIVATCIAGAFLSWQAGPVGVALLFMGFSAYVTGLEAHRRATG